MDLYHLHRPNPPTPQQGKPPYEQGAREVDPASHDQALRHVAHWKSETEKMDRIAREAMTKLEEKRAAKRALKAQLVTAGKEAESWRERYNALARSQQDNLTRPDPDSALSQLQAKLASIESERPLVQEKLRVGGQAFRELAKLKPAAEKLAAANAAHEKTIGELRAELAAAKAATQKGERDVASSIRKLELEIVAGKEKLRAATQEASAKSAKLAACTDMLMRAEQVLKTCSQLHSASEDSAPLGEALKETTANLAKFLQTLRPSQ
jgi:hypothetical protein